MAEKKTRKRAYIPPSSEVVNRKAHTTSSPRSGGRPAAGAGANNPRSANYVYPTPSLKRTARRLPIYFLLIFGLQYFLSRNEHPDDSVMRLLTIAAVQAAIVTIVFAPFMHWMDKLSYNRWLKRTGGAAR